jgi:hypothetical protein
MIASMHTSNKKVEEASKKYRDGVVVFAEAIQTPEIQILQKQRLQEKNSAQVSSSPEQ